jgi:hypothetical protein
VCSQKHVSLFQAAGGSLFIRKGETLIPKSPQLQYAAKHVFFHSALVCTLLQIQEMEERASLEMSFWTESISLVIILKKSTKASTRHAHVSLGKIRKTTFAQGGWEEEKIAVSYNTTFELPKLFINQLYKFLRFIFKL